MAISLGDINFGVGADMTDLQKSVTQLQNFGRVVDNATNSVNQISAALRRQEKAAVDAAVKVQNLGAQFSKIKGSEAFVSRANSAFTQFNNTMTSGVNSTLNFQRAQEQLKVSLAGVQRDFKNHAASAQGAFGANGRLVESLRNLQAAAVFTTGPLGGVATRVMAFTSVVKTGGFAMASFVAGVAAAVTVLYKIGEVAAEAGAKFISYKNSLKAITGSTFEANRELDNAIKVARDAGIAIDTTVPSFIKFTAAAEGTALQGEKAQKIFSTFAKASTVLGLSAEESGGVFKALEQMISKGTVQAEELRGQLGDRLPGAFQLAARAMGVTTSKLGDMMKKGLVPTVEFLPKLEAELRRTFGISEGPINTYASALGNLQNSITQLLVAVNEKFDITGKIQKVTIFLTELFDNVRLNLDDIVAKTAIFGSIFALAIGAGIPALMALIASIDKFGNSITMIEGHSGTLRDYMVLLWDDIKVTTTSSWKLMIDTMLADLNYFIPNAQEKFQNFVPDANSIASKTVEWLNGIEEPINNVLNGLINFSVAAFEGLVNSWHLFPDAVASGVIDAINGMIQVVASGIQMLLDSSINPLIRGIAAIRQLVGNDAPIMEIKIDTNFELLTPKFKNAGLKASEAFDNGFIAHKNKDYMADINKDLDDFNKRINTYPQNLQKRADTQANTRNDKNNASTEKKDAYDTLNAQIAAADRQQRLQETLAKYGNDSGGSSGGSKTTSKAAERSLQSINDINEAIGRTQEEIDALGGSEAGLKSLNEEFKRRDEVEKYGNALRKAGVDSVFIKEKTDELYNLLTNRDALKQAQEGMKAWSDAMSKSVDFFSESLVSLAFDGADAFKSIGDSARSLAKDLVNTFLQLSLSNPLKNLLFGQANPTLNMGGGSGSILGSLGSLLGSVFGGGTGISPTSSSWTANTTYGSFLGLRNGGVSTSFGEYTKAANGIISSPTFLSSGGGTVQAGEAGHEAIMPLSRDASGALGVRASSPNTGNVYVNVYTPEGQTASKKQSTGANGDQFIDIIVSKAKDAITGDIASGGTAVNAALEGRYALNASKGLTK